jgi:hypothetical protein
MVTTESALSPKSSSLLANNSFSIASLITQQQQQQPTGTTLIDSNIDWLKQKSVEIYNSDINLTPETKSREGLFF